MKKNFATLPFGFIILLLISLSSCELGEEDPAPTEKNKAPTITDQIFQIDENSQSGTIVGKIVASDPENDNLVFTLTSNEGNFSLSNAGELSVLNEAAMDYESNPFFEIVVKVADAELSSQAIITINLNDVDESLSNNTCSLTVLDYGDGSITFTSDADGNTISIVDSYINEDSGASETEEIKLTYSNGKVISGVWLDNGVTDSQLSFTYDGDQLTKIVDNYTSGKSEYRFFYNQDQLSKIEEWYEESGTLILDDTYLFSYTGVNVTTIDEVDSDQSAGKQTLGYDSKPNPFYHDLAAFIFFENFAWYVSANNATNLTQTYSDNSYGYSETFSYSYNEDDFPTKINILFEDAEPPNETNQNTYNLSYICE